MPFAWKIVTRDTQSSPCRKNGLSTFIRQIFNGRKKRFARPIVRLGNPILRPPEGRFDDGNETTKRTTERFVFQARQRYFASPASLFCILFSDKPEKSMSAKRCRTNRCRKNGPSETSRAFGASEMGLRRDFAPDGAKNRKGVSPFRFLSFQKAHGNNGRCRLRSRRRSGCGNRPWPAARPLRRWSYSRSPRS